MKDSTFSGLIIILFCIGAMCFFYVSDQRDARRQTLINECLADGHPRYACEWGTAGSLRKEIPNGNEPRSKGAVVKRAA